MVVISIYKYPLVSKRGGRVADPGFERRRIAEFSQLTLSEWSCGMLSWKILKSKASIHAFLSHFPPKYYYFLFF